MNSIVWVLLIVASGMYGMPVPVRLTFDTEAACEKARATVTAQRQPITTSCEPARATKAQP
jgi:hypothetical protein